MRILLAALLTFAVGCSGGMTTKGKVGFACDSATAALQALTAARVANRISKADLDKAISVHETTNRFCEPVAESISPADYAALLSAVARLSAQQGESQ